MSRTPQAFFQQAHKTFCEVWFLIKKDFTEKRSARKNSKKDGWGTATTMVLSLLLMTALVYFVSQFAKQYCAIPFYGESVPLVREAEILAIVYAFAFFLNFVGGVGKIYSTVANADDICVLQVLPISGSSIFLYKLVRLYGYQVMQNLILLLPIAITLAVVMQNNVGFYIGALFTVLSMPVLALFLASLIAVPMSRVIDYFKTRYILLLAIFVLVIFVGFFLYSQVLKILENLLATGNIQFFFNENTMNSISAFAKYSFPSNLFADLTVGINAGVSFLLIAAAVIIAFFIMYFVVRKQIPKMLRIRLEGKQKFEKVGSKKIRLRSPFCALLQKESLIVLRTPTYALGYFAVAVLLPFMCYLSIGLVDKLLSSLVGAQAKYEIAVFVVTMFAMLSNTFAATNISRDGTMAQHIKTMPVTIGAILGAKVLFSAIVTEVAILLSVITLAVTGFVNAWEAIGVFFFVSVLSIAEILVATKLDLNHPKCVTSEDGEIKESASVSKIALFGLITAVIVGAVFLILSLVLNIRNLSAIRPYVVGGVSMLISATFLGLSLLYFFKGSKKRFFGGL